MADPISPVAYANGPSGKALTVETATPPADQHPALVYVARLSEVST